MSKKMLQKKRVEEYGRGIAARERGASLLEILVVLVIILFGVFAIIRVFPVGLGTFRTTESRTLAGQLAQQQDEQLKADAANLPQGISLGYFDNSGNRILDGTQDPDDLRPYQPGAILGTGTANTTVNPYFSDINRARYIEGEGVKVPPATNPWENDLTNHPNGANFRAAVYLIKFGPVFLANAYGTSSWFPNTDADATALDQYMRIYGAPWQSITAPYRVDSSNNDNSVAVQGYLRGPQSYLIDYADSDDPDDKAPNAAVLFPANTKDKIFFISYVHRVSNTEVYEDKIALKSLGGVWQPILDKNNATVVNVLAGSDRVFREFKRLGVDTTQDTVHWTTDPYEYALLDNNLNSSFANTGRIAFNPAGANYSVQTAYGDQPFTAYIDYSVLDWHILREDREVPTGVAGANGESIIRTTLGNLKRIGDPNPDDTIYAGLFGDKLSDIIVIDLATGQTLTAGDYNSGTPTANSDYWIDNTDTGTYRTGTIYINTNRVPQGSHIRILYKADGEWGVAVQKAYTQYLERDDPTNTGCPVITEPATYSRNQTNPDDTVLIFNQSEYNKSFVARFQYVNTNGQTVQTAPEQLTLNGQPVARGTQGATFANVDAAAYMPGRATGTAWSVVGNMVTGVSIKTRVIYRDTNSNAAGGAVNGTGAPEAGWRVQDVDTYLTPTPAQY